MSLTAVVVAKVGFGCAALSSAERGVQWLRRLGAWQGEGEGEGEEVSKRQLRR